MTMTARRALTGAGVLLAVACGMAVSRVAAERTVTPLPDYGPLPEFSLTDQQDRPVRLADLQGTVWVADFIFTRCAGQCPMMTAHMAELQRQFARSPHLRLVSFTVDPAHDTPGVLADYARHSGAGERWQFLTGEAEAVAALAQRGFRLGLSDEGSPQEPITHSVRLVLMDRQGRLRGYYDATDAEAMRQLSRDIRRLLSSS